MTKQLIKNFQIGNISADVGSDWHKIIAKPDLVGDIIDQVRRQQLAETLFCLGDLFDTDRGEDTSGLVNEFFHGIAPNYNRIVFLAGNHDLRGRPDPWRSFDLPGNTICPRGCEPVTIDIEGTKFLLANIFYDKKFIDPALLGLTAEEIRQQYQASDDGKYLLAGDTSLFPAMLERAASALTKPIDALVTHCLAHPSLVTFKVDEISDELAEFGRKNGIEFICSPEEDDKMVAAMKRWPDSQAYRKWWNIKSFIMGSNVIGDPRADPKNGLTIIHGHHHRNDLRHRMVNGKTIKVITHQPF